MNRYIKEVRKHIDFILIDLIVVALSYVFVCWNRYNMPNSPVNHGELFPKYGFILILIYLLVAVIGHNYKGIVRRGPFTEVKYVLKQMITSWSVFTAVLFLIREGHDFSRRIYISSFVMSLTFVYVIRTIWKIMLKFTKMYERILNRLLIVTERDHVDDLVSFLVTGTYSCDYEICGICCTEEGSAEYKDYFPYCRGLDKLAAFTEQVKPTDVYVSLWDAKKEEEILDMFLGMGITAHKSLHSSNMKYHDQKISRFNEVSVITIVGKTPSLIHRGNQFLKSVRRHLSSMKQR